jgi:hypothetical protein
VVDVVIHLVRGVRTEVVLTLRRVRDEAHGPQEIGSPLPRRKAHRKGAPQSSGVHARRWPAVRRSRSTW